MSSQHDAYALGYTHATMGHNRELQHRKVQLISVKLALSWDWGLKFDPMNLELVVIAGQLYRGEYVLVSCTHCPSSQQSRGHLNHYVSSERVNSAMGAKS